MLEGFIKTASNELETIRKTVTRIGKLSISSITGGSAISGKGVLRKILITDTPSSGTLNATIAINIDGAGAVTISADTMMKNLNTNSTDGAGYASGLFTVTSATAERKAAILELDLPFRTSLDVSITNADGFCIMWEEEV